MDPDAEGVAKMRASEIKAELDMRGVGYEGIYEKVVFRNFRNRVAASWESSSVVRPDGMAGSCFHSHGVRNGKYGF